MSTKARPSSPTKSPKKRPAAAPTSNDYEQMLLDQQHQMQMVISEKEIEIERLKTTVVSLNAKCSVVDDHVEDVKNTTNRINDSENQRA